LYLSQLSPGWLFRFTEQDFNLSLKMGSLEDKIIGALSQAPRKQSYLIKLLWGFDAVEGSLEARFHARLGHLRSKKGISIIKFCDGYYSLNLSEFNL
jgi:hypothetical protein